MHHADRPGARRYALSKCGGPAPSAKVECGNGQPLLALCRRRQYHQAEYSGEAACITRQSTPTPKGVSALRAHLVLGAGYFYVIHRRASRFVPSFESRRQRARFKRRVAGVGFNGRACGGRRRFEVRLRSTARPLSVCGAAPLRKSPGASSGSSAAKHSGCAGEASIVAKHPRANILNLAEAVSWRRACSQVASTNRTGEAYA
jgi:hypothetical protein